jgi:4-amino-4-deoxy-L-arabinose transferase-like glycosyltransferase
MTAQAQTTPVRSGRLLGGALLFLSVAYYAALAPYGLELADEGHLVNQIYRTYLGQLPYVDFHTGYSPGVYYWNAALFGLFGVNLLVLRLCLAVVNGLTVYAIYWLARRVGESRLAAAVTALLYLAFVPFYEGRFAPFNIPYPAWYVTLFWLLSVICMVRWWESGRAFLWLLAGLCAGVVFAFKQNSGLFNLAAVGITVPLLERVASEAHARRGWLAAPLARAEPAMQWLVPLLGAIAVTLMFGQAGSREVRLYAVPLTVLVLWQLLAPSARIARPVPALQLWRDMLLVAVGFAVVTLPWAVYFWMHLGTAPFLRAIFYIGVSYEQFYYISFPPIGRWGIAIACGIGGATAVGLLINRRRLPPRLVVGAMVAGFSMAAFQLLRHPPPMIEGFQRSVVMRVQDVAFALVLFTEWAAIVAHIVQTRRWSARWNGNRQAAGLFLIVLLSAILMHAQLYPRSDFMHLVYAAPCVLVLGARLLDVLADLWARGLARSRRARLAIRIVVAAPVCAVALVVLAPALERIDYLARSGWGRDANAVVRLSTPRAPLVIDPAAGRMLLSLSATVRYVREHSRPDQYVFTFPCLDFVSFLADRRDPTRHGYYYPGSPGHAVEAEVIDALRAHPPRHIVALHDHALFFDSAPLYYFNLHQFVTRHYRLERRVGMFDVLRSKLRGPDLAAKAGAVLPVTAHDAPDDWAEGEDDGLGTGDREADTLADTVALWRRELQNSRGAVAREIDPALGTLSTVDFEALATVIGGLTPSAQQAVARLVLLSRSSAGAAALAVALQNPSVSEATAVLFLRVISAVGDIRAVVPMLAALPESTGLKRDTLASGLFIVASKSWVENYWYAASKPAELPRIEKALPAAQLIQWMDNPWESLALRSFAIRMAGQRQDRAVIPYLVRVLGDANEHPQLRADAAYTLVQLGFGPAVFPVIGKLLRGGDVVPAVLTVELYPQAPETGRTLLLESMSESNADVRAQAFWVAAAVRDPELLSALHAGLSDAVPEVRQAAAWALGNIGDVSSLPVLQQAAHDGNDDVEAFAKRAIQRIAIGEAGVKDSDERSVVSGGTDH